MTTENNNTGSTEKQDTTTDTANVNSPVNAAPAASPEMAPTIHHAPVGQADHGDPVQVAKDDPAVSANNPINNETAPAAAAPATDTSNKIPDGEKQITLKVDGVTHVDKTFPKGTTIAAALSAFGVDCSKLEFTDAATGAKVSSSAPLSSDKKVNATAKGKGG